MRMKDYYRTKDYENLLPDLLVALEREDLVKELSKSQIKDLANHFKSLVVDIGGLDSDENRIMALLYYILVNWADDMIKYGKTADEF